MRAITISLNEELVLRLEERAQELGITFDALVQAVLRSAITPAGPEFDQFLDENFVENHELFKRLADK